jgi:hypothetical protein
MQHDRRSRKYPSVLVSVLVLALVMLSLNAFASKDPKPYPEVGKIVATGVTEWVINRQHQFAHTYTVVTDSRSYVLECSHKPIFGTMGEECGGSKKLQIGDVIHFRIDKNQAYIPITKTDDSIGEEKLHILSTALKPDTPPAPSDKTEAKPPGPN